MSNLLGAVIDSIDYVTGIGNAIEIARALHVAALELELAHFFASGFSMSSTSEESPPPDPRCFIPVPGYSNVV